MILRMFAIFDSKAEAFIQPFFSPTVALALRSFTAAANDEATDFNRFAGDYTLFELASVDQQSGKVTPLDAPHNLGTAITLLSKANT